MPGWRQRDAYSRDEASGSQLHVLPHCYEGSVTGVTDAIQRAGGPDLRVFCPTRTQKAGADRLPHQRFVSGVREAFEADERAGGEKIGKSTAIGQTQIIGRQFGQGIKNERAFLHVVMRDFQARFIDQAITE
ncbi:hypothetical protein SAMN03097715_04957 [Pseudomonas putida]|nr:hypothetical protein SAMN03097715_04957 [Pseudomonas putida]